MNPSVMTYRAALNRVRETSRELASEMEAAERRGTNFAVDDRFREIWSAYQQVLDECHEAFAHVPPQQRSLVPRPPSV